MSAKLEQARALRAAGVPIREIARRLDIPYTTAQTWLGTKKHRTMEDIREAAADRTLQIRELRDDGMGVRAIARELGCSPATVMKAVD